MQCPVCNLDLVMSERQGVEIDYCPKCRGVWLDRGELDKIIEKSAVTVPAPTQHVAPTQQYPAAPAQHQPAQDYSNSRYSDDHHKKKRKENPFADLFDF